MLTDISVAKNNSNYKSFDGNLFSKDGKTLIRYVGGEPTISFAIPEGVTSIGECAFGECKKKNLTVKGLFGSYAEMYAKKNDIPFEAI